MRKLTSSIGVAMLCFGMAGTATAATYSFSSTDTPLPISDGDWTYADIPVDQDLGTVRDITVYVDIQHEWIYDLEVYLAHQKSVGDPWEYSIPLYDHDAIPYTTSLSLETQVSDFMNDSVGGIWSLAVYDYSESDTGNLLSFRVSIENNDDAPQGNPVPLPGAVVLLGSGLSALAALRRSKHK